MASEGIFEKTHGEVGSSGKEERKGKRPSEHQEARSEAKEVVPGQTASLAYREHQGDVEAKGK